VVKPLPLYRGKATRYPLYWRVGWVTGSIWANAKNLASTGFRTSDRPAPNELLDLLSTAREHKLSFDYRHAGLTQDGAN